MLKKERKKAVGKSNVRNPRHGIAQHQLVMILPKGQDGKHRHGIARSS